MRLVAGTVVSTNGLPSPGGHEPLLSRALILREVELTADAIAAAE